MKLINIVEVREIKNKIVTKADLDNLGISVTADLPELTEAEFKDAIGNTYRVKMLDSTWYGIKDIRDIEFDALVITFEQTNKSLYDLSRDMQQHEVYSKLLHAVNYRINKNPPQVIMFGSYDIATVPTYRKFAMMLKNMYYIIYDDMLEGFALINKEYVNNNLASRKEDIESVAYESMCDLNDVTQRVHSDKMNYRSVGESLKNKIGYYRIQISQLDTPRPIMMLNMIGAISIDSRKVMQFYNTGYLPDKYITQTEADNFPTERIEVELYFPTVEDAFKNYFIKVNPEANVDDTIKGKLLDLLIKQYDKMIRDVKNNITKDEAIVRVLQPDWYDLLLGRL